MHIECRKNVTQFKMYVLDRAFNGSKRLGVPFRKGAIKYFKEKGVWLSDTDLQQLLPLFM